MIPKNKHHKHRTRIYYTIQVRFFNLQNAASYKYYFTICFILGVVTEVLNYLLNSHQNTSHLERVSKPQRMQIRLSTGNPTAISSNDLVAHCLQLLRAMSYKNAQVQMR